MSTSLFPVGVATDILLRGYRTRASPAEGPIECVLRVIDLQQAIPEVRARVAFPPAAGLMVPKPLILGDYISGQPGGGCWHGPCPVQELEAGFGVLE